MNSGDVSEYNKRGADYAVSGEYQRALAEFSQAILIQPQEASSYYNRALVYRSLSDYQQALVDLQQVLTLLPTYALAYYQRGITYYLLCDNRRAIHDFSTALALNEQNIQLDVQSLVGRSVVYVIMEEYEQALLNLNRAIGLDERVAGRLGAYGNRGQAFAALKRYDEAITDFYQALYFKPDDVILLNRLGAAYTDSGRPEHSLEHYQKALSLQPRMAFTYNNRGEAYRLLERYDEALADFNQALEIDEMLATVYYNRGLVYENLVAPQQSINDYTHALSLDPTFIAIYHDRAGLYCRNKQYQAAVQDYTTALVYDPSDAMALFGRGTMYLYLEQPLDAVEDFNRVIDLQPDFACAYNNRGEAYLYLRNLWRAREDCLHSWHLDTSHADHGWMAQWVNICLQEPDESMPDVLERIAAEEPADYAAYLCRGVAYFLRQQHTLALQELEYALTLNAEKWDAYFWKGMISASLAHEDEALASLQRAVALKIPAVLLSPLHWLQHEHADFYIKHASTFLRK
ncbi:tetratricopeptide repeat protein [Dictyobacter arantiisoli]|uniref:Uncharacterized protein n=1 Tax=Dictyobacter arantiisoli TaxID=2014874 RepID=A0A5A5TL50_9CHLR|nr:tetratricopeptide repeat protein [Dictyobacter arantiisoli]GCF11829.1 hypothetical protein KDI_53930 [Dictyobacter arantiisoli]